MAHASPAASFLSAFSPPSSVGNRSPSPPPPQQGSGRLGRRTAGNSHMPAFGSVFLPPRGDQSGYKIVVPASPKGNEYEYEYEYVLGRELGRGGMGLVREATRRKIRRGRRHRQQQQSRSSERSRENDATAVEMEDDDDAAVTMTTSSSDADEEEEGVIRVAVKIIPRHQGHALPFSEAMGIRTNSGGGIGGPVRAGGGGGGATDGTTVQRSASLRQHHQGGGGGPSSSSSSSLLAGATHVQRSFSLSQSQSPFGSSGKLLRHHPSQFAPSSSTSSSSSSSASESRTTAAGGGDSNGSPARRNAPVGYSNLGYGGGRHSNNNLRPGTLSRGISLAAVEQSPLPTPDAEQDELLLGTSAPERDPGGFFNRARANTVGPAGDRPTYSASSSRGSSSTTTTTTADEGGGGGGGPGGNPSRRDGSNEAPPTTTTTTIDLDTAEPEDLLDLLLQREIALWRQLTNLAPLPHTGIAMPRPTGFTGKGGHPYVVALLGTHRSDEFDYIFMPLAEGGTLLEYLNDPSNASSRGSTSRSRSCSRSGRGSRSVSPSRSASPPASRGPGRSASRGRTGRVTTTTTTKPRPRASIPFAGSLSPPPSATAAAAAEEKKGLSLRRAGEIFLQIVDGLRWMHEEARVVHRDLKLENVVGCWSVATDEELARAAAAAEEEAAAVAQEEEAEKEGMMTRGRSRSRMRRDHDQQHENRYKSKSRDAAASGAGGGGRHRRKRVWKLADFGLAEILPHSAAPQQQQQSGVQGVQPLAALARAGSLHRPDGGQPHGLASSVGPGGPSGLSHSAILPRPPAHASTLPAQQVHRPSPTAATMQAQAVSPLSALLHPVGSLPYSSPEALRSSVPIVHPSGDIWALGCILYALVAGRLPIWDDWELRLRVQLVKGEWEVPEELDSTRARNEDDRVEREMVLEVLKGCLEKDVERRWTIRQVCESRWIRLVRQRDSDARAGRTPTTATTTTAAATVAVQVEPVPAVLRRSSMTRTAAQSLGLFLDVQQQSSAGGGSGRGSPGRSTSSHLSLGPSPSPTSPNSDRTLSRGRPSTRSSSHSYSHGPPPAPSAGASGHHTADGGSSPVIGRSNLVVGEERGRSAQSLPKSASRSRTRLSTRSTSRSSAYAHQYGAGGGSELAEQERKERGRSERRRRWDEAGSSSGRRSVSRTSTGTTTSTSASGMMDDNNNNNTNSGLAGQSTPAEQDEDLMRDDGEGDDLALASASLSGPSQRAGRSTSRRRHGVSSAASARGDREDSGSRSGPAHHLETVGEPY